MKKKFNLYLLTAPIFCLLLVNFFVMFGFSVSTRAQQNKTETSSQTLLASQTVLTTAPYTATDLFYAALNHLNTQTNVTVTSEGVSQSFVTQQVYQTKAYDGSTYFTQTVTTGYKNAANRIYYTKDYDLTFLKAKSVSTNQVVWQGGTITNFSYDAYVEKYHILPDTFFPYTFTNNSFIATSAPTKTASGYTFTCSLHPTLATKEYAKNLQTTFKLKNEVTFQTVTLTVHLNLNKEFVSVGIEEAYQVNLLGFVKNCIATYQMNFDFFTKTNIPVIES